MSEGTGFDIWCGLDVGKQAHHACALDTAGKKVFDKPLPQDQAKLEELFAKLQAHGRVLVVVDQPNTIGALPIAVARSMGITVAYLPGLVMRRIADLHPGNAKTDARDAFIIADAARTMPMTLRRIDLGEETLAELKILVGFDDDLAAEATRLSNRIRGLLTQIHPALERVIGPRLTTKQGLAVIEQLGGSQSIAHASKSKLLKILTKANARGAQAFADAITQALTEQTVTVAGTAAAEQILPKLAASLRSTLEQRTELAVQVEKVVDAHPLAEGMALDARRRGQDRSTNPARRRRRVAVPDRRASGRLRGPRTSHPPIRNQHPRRVPRPVREQTPETGPIPVRLRRTTFRSRQPHLLRPQTSPGQTPQRRTHLPVPTPLRRPVRHAPKPRALPGSRTNPQAPRHPSPSPLDEEHRDTPCQPRQPVSGRAVRVAAASRGPCRYGCVGTAPDSSCRPAERPVNASSSACPVPRTAGPSPWAQSRSEASRRTSCSPLCLMSPLPAGETR